MANLPCGIDQALQPPKTENYAPNSHVIRKGIEMIFEGSVPPLNYSTISGYPNQVPRQAPEYENFASYTVVAAQNQPAPNLQPPVCMLD
jgi:hypothetical protein